MLSIMTLIELKGNNKFLYEVAPYYFPEGYLTETEVLLWELYYRDKQNKR